MQINYLKDLILNLKVEKGFHNIEIKKETASEFIHIIGSYIREIKFICHYLLLRNDDLRG